MDQEYKRAVASTVEALVNSGARKATKYLSPKLVVTATRKVFGGKIDKRDKNIEIVLKLGRPNYAERGFIKLCEKAKVPFPVRNIQFKFFK